jgi:Ca2+-dependent lipid-binding protein
LNPKKAKTLKYKFCSNVIMEEKDHATTDYLKYAGTGYKAGTKHNISVLCCGKAVKVVSIKTYEQIY